MTLPQDNCIFKYTLFCFCIITAFIGLYLAFIREKNNIDRGKYDIQKGSANIKEWSFTFGFAMGLLLVLIGIVGSVYCIKVLPGCPSKNSSVEKDIKVNTISASNVYTGKVETNVFTTDPINIDVDKENIKIKGLHAKEQNVLKVTGNYRFTTNSEDYPSDIALNIYLDNELIKTVTISLDINNDLKFEETIPFDEQPSSIQLQLNRSDLPDPDYDYIYFKNGLKIGMSDE